MKKIAPCFALVASLLFGTSFAYADTSENSQPEMDHSAGTAHLDQLFYAADVNHDDGLDRREAQHMPMLTQYFTEVDSNKNGKVTRQEYFEAMPLLHGVKHINPANQTDNM